MKRFIQHFGDDSDHKHLKTCGIITQCATANQVLISV